MLYYVLQMFYTLLQTVFHLSCKNEELLVLETFFHQQYNITVFYNKFRTIIHNLKLIFKNQADLGIVIVHLLKAWRVWVQFAIVVTRLQPGLFCALFLPSTVPIAFSGLVKVGHGLQFSKDFSSSFLLLGAMV